MLSKRWIQTAMTSTNLVAIYAPCVHPIQLLVVVVVAQTRPASSQLVVYFCSCCFTPCDVLKHVKHCLSTSQGAINSGACHQRSVLKTAGRCLSRTRREAVSQQDETRG